LFFVVQVMVSGSESGQVGDSEGGVVRKEDRPSRLGVVGWSGAGDDALRVSFYLAIQLSSSRASLQSRDLGSRLFLEGWIGLEKCGKGVGGVMYRVSNGMSGKVWVQGWLH